MQIIKLLNEIKSGNLTYTSLSNKNKFRLESIILAENLQLTEKVYFKSGIASDIEKNCILSVTNGDSCTKFIADIYFTNYKEQLKKAERLLEDKETYDIVVHNLNIFYKELKDYKSTIFPILDFNMLDGTKIETQNIILSRSYLIDKLNELPSIAFRNCINKKHVYDEEDLDKLYEYVDDIVKFINEKLSAKTDKNEKTIDTLFRSKDLDSKELRGIEDWYEELQTLKDNKTETQEMEELWYTDIHRMIKSLKSTKIIGESERYIIMRVVDYRDLTYLGCNSLWCFSNPNYDDESKQAYFDSYNENGIIYLIYDKDDYIGDSQKMYVIVSRFIVDGIWVSYFTHPEHKNDGYDKEAKTPINTHPSTFYNMLDLNLTVGEAKKVWKKVEDSFESHSEYNKMFKIISDWW